MAPSKPKVQVDEDGDGDIDVTVEIDPPSVPPDVKDALRALVARMEVHGTGRRATYAEVRETLRAIAS